MGKKDVEPMKKQVDEVKEVKKIEPVFSKTAILASKRFANRQDALGVILDDTKEYTISEAEKLLEKFMKGQVN